MNAQRLSAVWIEWAGAASALVSLLDQQESALVSRDTARVEDLLPEIEKSRHALEAVDERAREASTAFAEKLGCVPSLTGIMTRLSPTEAGSISALAQRVKDLGEGLREAMIRNHSLIVNELAYVAATLTLVGQTLRDPTTPYGKGTAGALTVDRTV